MGFGVKKHDTPRFWQVQNLRFRYDVSPISLYSLEVPRFWQAQVGHGFFWRQKHGSYEIPQDFDRPAKPKISIRCKPNIFVLFKKPQDFEKPHRQWVFGVKNLVFKKNEKMVLKMKFWYNVGPKSLHSSKILRFWQEKVGHHGFWASKTWFLWNTPRFRQVLNLRFRYDVSPISL